MMEDKIGLDNRRQWHARSRITNNQTKPPPPPAYQLASTNSRSDIKPHLACVPRLLAQHTARAS